MAASLNKVTLIGNIGKDPEIRSTQTGIKIATITLATSDRWTDRTTGEVKENTEWHRIVIFGGGLADIVERYLRKGAKIYVEGALQTRKWTDQSGQDRYSTEIALRPYGGTLIMLDGNGAARGASDPGAAQSRDDNDLHDDIPF